MKEVNLERGDLFVTGGYGTSVLLGIYAGRGKTGTVRYIHIPDNLENLKDDSWIMQKLIALEKGEGKPWLSYYGSGDSAGHGTYLKIYETSLTKEQKEFVNRYRKVMNL